MSDTTNSTLVPEDITFEEQPPKPRRGRPKKNPVDTVKQKPDEVVDIPKSAPVDEKPKKVKKKSSADVGDIAKQVYG
jgi:hypothetical protein